MLISSYDGEDMHPCLSVSYATDKEHDTVYSLYEWIAYMWNVWTVYFLCGFDSPVHVIYVGVLYDLHLILLLLYMQNGTYTTKAYPVPYVLFCYPVFSLP